MTKKSNHQYPEWAIIHRKPATELRFINKTYYLYEVGSKYDPITKRGKKITGKLLGKIVEGKGFIASAKKQLSENMSKSIDTSKISVKEYGVTDFINSKAISIIEKLKFYFPEDYDMLLYTAYCRFVHQSSIKNMPFYISKTMLSIDFTKAVSELLTPTSY